MCLAAYYRIIRIHFGSIVLFMGFPNPGIYIFRDLLKCSLYSIRTSEFTKLYCNEPLENSQSMKVGSHKSDWFHIMCVYRQLNLLFCLQTGQDQRECYGSRHPFHAGPESRGCACGHREQLDLTDPAGLWSGHARR